MVRRMQGLVIVAAMTVLAALGLRNDFFEGCKEIERDAETQPECVYVPPVWIENEPVRRFPYVALRKNPFRSGGYYNTVLNLTRASIRRIFMEKGIRVGAFVEFTTVRSSCKVTNTPVYSEKLCRPTSNKVNGLCQAGFEFHKPHRVLAVACHKFP
ncbi:uncharacterized protein LOC120849252 [Ixodes scapularis]|uniref:uncharacterized protein LOC120849252 n=1 Tax=Ixodes scapularis TaxID=6945 RepID=UPI001A9F7BAE|nr:uncharacterized protein LOC120849252 [Ixodes scapularis]